MIWQLDVNREDYLAKYGWLRIEDDGAKWHCWACHEYGGAKDKLETAKARPSRQEKLSEHAKNPAHIEAMRMHEAKLKRAKQADEVSNTLFASSQMRRCSGTRFAALCGGHRRHR